MLDIVLIIGIAFLTLAVISINATNVQLRNELMNKNNSYHIEKLQLLSIIAKYTPFQVSNLGEIKELQFTEDIDTINLN